MIATEKMTVKPLALDGVKPSVESPASEQYPLGRSLFVLYRLKDLSPESKKFLEFLKIEEAAAIIKVNGYVLLVGKQRVIKAE